MHTQALKMTRSAAVALPKDSARETYDASHPRVGLQHEVIAAHSSRWPFGAELLDECKSPGTRPDRARFLAGSAYYGDGLHLNEAGICLFTASLAGPIQDLLRPIGFAD